MSKKTNITYIKPEEPNFLKRIKEQAGYKEGPSVDTKREALPAINPEDLEDSEDEQPTIVVLKSGDLTAEEAKELQDKLEKEESSKPADLSERVIFRRPTKSKTDSEPTERSSASSNSKRSNPRNSKEKGPKEKRAKQNKPLLSFDEDENDD